MSHNTTDYNFPPMWGQMSNEQKCEWFTQERAARQAARQDTAWGRGYDAHIAEQERLSTDEYRVDDSETLK